MRDEFEIYLKIIGMTDVLINRVGAIYAFYQEVCPEALTGIFVSDSLNEDGTREYQNLWFFSQSYMMEAKRFVNQDDFDMARMHKCVSYWVLRKQDYDFQEATEKSRLYIEINLRSGIDGFFRASKENCDYLKDIFRAHILANLEA